MVGIPNHGTLRIGDTLTEGEDLVFRGVPSFAPEILRRVKLTDAMKAKKLREALQQMAEEGVVQTFVPHDGSGAIVGRGGGAAARRPGRAAHAAEYGLPVAFEQQPVRGRAGGSRPTIRLELRSSSSTAYPSSTATDLDGAPVFLASSAFTLRYEQDRWPQVTFSDIKDYQRAAA